MTKLEIKDKYKVDDFHSKVRGIVTVRNLEDGSILFTKENTIVKTGRNFLLNNAFGGSAANPTFYFYMSTAETVEQASDTMNSIEGAGKTIVFRKVIEPLPINWSFLGAEIFATPPDSSEENNRGTKAYSLLETEGDDALQVTNHIQITIDPSNFSLGSNETLLAFNGDTTAKCAGLIFRNGSDDNLFSRVTFEGITLKLNAKYLIDYYIYF